MIVRDSGVVVVDCILNDGGSDEDAAGIAAVAGRGASMVVGQECPCQMG